MREHLVGCYNIHPTTLSRWFYGAGCYLVHVVPCVRTLSTSRTSRVPRQPGPALIVLSTHCNTGSFNTRSRVSLPINFLLVACKQSGNDHEMYWNTHNPTRGCHRKIIPRGDIEDPVGIVFGQKRSPRREIKEVGVGGSKRRGYQTIRNARTGRI